ncbi:Rieske (2Fe-2S) protein [Mameliella sp.]|uniref:Rieske (2Fe-2S) protein n=1 Tax=Mameliella sp. TaxID=1924940 RepID=UPI003BACEDEB
MSEAWKNYRGAPREGTRICALSEVPDGNTLCLVLDGFPVLVVRRGDEVRAYVNACPHQYLPLDHKGDRLISADRTILRCTNHAAGFSVTTGEGVEGLGIGKCLDMIPVVVDGHSILVGDAGAV